MPEESRRDEVLAWAEKMGLGKVAREFPGDVLAAAEAAAKARSASPAPDDPAAEPWPPMRVGGSR